MSNKFIHCSNFCNLSTAEICRPVEFEISKFQSLSGIQLLKNFSTKLETNLKLFVRTKIILGELFTNWYPTTFVRGKSFGSCSWKLEFAESFAVVKIFCGFAILSATKCGRNIGWEVWNKFTRINFSRRVLNSRARKSFLSCEVLSAAKKLWKVHERIKTSERIFRWNVSFVGVKMFANFWPSEDLIPPIKTLFGVKLTSRAAHKLFVSWNFRNSQTFRGWNIYPSQTRISRHSETFVCHKLSPGKYFPLTNSRLASKLKTFRRVNFPTHKLASRIQLKYFLLASARNSLLTNSHLASRLKTFRRVNFSATNSRLASTRKTFRRPNSSLTNFPQLKTRILRHPRHFLRHEPLCVVKWTFSLAAFYPPEIIHSRTFLRQKFLTHKTFHRVNFLHHKTFSLIKNFHSQHFILQKFLTHKTRVSHPAKFLLWLNLLLTTFYLSKIFPPSQNFRNLQTLFGNWTSTHKLASRVQQIFLRPQSFAKLLLYKLASVEFLFDLFVKIWRERKSLDEQ